MLLRLAQLSMAISFYFTGNALYHTWGHGFSNDFFGQTISPHMQFHAVREVFAALGLVIIVAWFMYGPASVRNRTNWITMLIASTFLTVGVLAALPITDSVLPNLAAKMNHYGNTGFAALALALCWKEYFQKGASESGLVNSAASMGTS
jgi:hypothetical protein